ncbi:MAG TPA: class I SAM-dependent methyltransferase [Chitinophagaceae bacterium]|nr:class I SAM-dependent methyltransferase [Chitinophagaceae bacterium]
MIEVPTSAWKGLELIVKDIMQQSETSNKRCLEFGVEYGYSVAVFANYFEEVTGVDIFTGDIHAGFHGDILEKTKNNLRDFPNIKLIRSDYKDYITRDQSRYDLIHVDIVHTYEATYDCGLWSALHADCTIFHDTETFPEVKKAVRDIARKTGKQFYNYPHHCGLGIVY